MAPLPDLMRRPLSIGFSLLAVAVAARPSAAQGGSAPDSTHASAVPKPWFERISFRGYVQLRYNRLLENNDELVCTACDRSMGKDGGIFLRRVRVILEARPTDRVTVLVQPELTADAAEGNGGFAQLRDAYVETALDSAHAYRMRFGLTNVPYGYDNLLSSSRRVPLDHDDALNSALPNETDLGVFFYWTPRVARERFRALAAEKGTGDFGVFSMGAFNGQTADRPEQNDNLHVAARLAWPFALGRSQIVEAALQAYTGRFVVTPANRTPGAVPSPDEFTDQRAAVSLVLHPRPFGIQAEWNVGRGPEADPVAHTIRDQHLDGGYVQAMLRTRPFGYQVIPYVRAQRYDGGKKVETDARRHQVRELESGVEWTVSRVTELTAAFMVAERNTADLATPENRQQGHRLRLQAQFSF